MSLKAASPITTKRRGYMSKLENTKIPLDERKNYSKTKTTKKKEAIKMPNEPLAPRAKKYQKTRGEHFKDVVIAILITAIVAFVAGASYTNKQQAELDKVRAEAQSSVQAEAPAKK